MSTKPLNYTDYDYTTLVAALVNQLSAKSSWKDLYASATGSMLIELFAAVGTEVLYYIERRAQESYIGTAQNLSSVINLVRLLNYTPVRNVSAIGNLDFIPSTLPVTSIITIPKYTNCKTASGTNYLTMIEGSIIPGQTSVTIPGIQGLIVSKNFTSTGAASQEYNIEDTQIENNNIPTTINGIPDWSSLIVTITSGGLPTVWTNVASFLDSITTSTHYVVRPELDGTLTIIFGNGKFGKAPLLGDGINVKFIHSEGLNGNVYNTGLITELSDSITPSVTVSNSTTFLGGDDAENIEEIRVNGPNVFATGDRLVTKADFNSVILAYPSVGDVNVWGENEETNPDYNMFNQVKIALILQNWILPNGTFKSNLSDFLYEKSLMTVRYSYIIPDILEVIPTLTVKLISGTSTSYVRSLIDLAFSSMFELGSTTKLGVSKYHSDIIGELEDVEGVDRVYLTLKVEKELSAEYNSLYDFAETMDVLPVTPGMVEIYIDDTRVAVDDGAGSWVSDGSSPTITGNVDYTVTGAVEVNISPAPAITEKVYVRYVTDQNGDIEVGKNQILKYSSNNVDYVSIS
jgi:hypothetical protein